VGGIVGLVLVAVAGWSLLSLAPLRRGGSESSLRNASALPWPYCAPDATPQPPPDPPWPELPPDWLAEGFPTGLDPYVSALVVPSAASPGDIRPSGLQEATVQIQEVLWQTAFGRTPELAEALPILPEPVVMVGEREVWAQMGESLSTGARVVIGIIDVWTDGTYSVYYALDADPAEPTFLGSSVVAERATGQFQAFLSWEGNPLGGTRDAASFLVAWNVEADAPAATWPIVTGPISVSYGKFMAQFSGETYPQPGSVEWWAKAPPECRSLMDAPSGVLDGLPTGEVWIHVPASWRSLQGGAFCLRISFGSTGCIEPASATASWPYLHFDEVYAVPGEPIDVLVAKDKNGALSWVENVRIGAIPFSLFISGASVLIELDPSSSPVSYDQLASMPDPTELTEASSLTTAENDALLGGIPSATPCDC
jgi:hypothetical protein